MKYLDKHGYEITSKAILFNSETGNKFKALVFDNDDNIYIDISKKQDLTACLLLQDLCGSVVTVDGINYYQLDDFNIWNNDIWHNKIK